MMVGKNFLGFVSVYKQIDARLHLSALSSANLFAVDEQVVRVIAKCAEKSRKRATISNVLSATKSPASIKILENWRKKAIRDQFSGNEEAFLKHVASTIVVGSRLHEYVTKRLFNDQSPVEDAEESTRKLLNAYLDSLEPVLKQITTVYCVKLAVSHPELRYIGECPAMLKYRGAPCIVTWKTSSTLPVRRRTTWQVSGEPIDAALQLCAYAGAVNRSEFVALTSAPTATTGQNAKTKQAKEHFVTQQPVENALIVTAYADGSPADVVELHKADLASCWTTWTDRVVAYWTKRLPSSVPRYPKKEAPEAPFKILNTTERKIEPEAVAPKSEANEVKSGMAQVIKLT